MENKYNKEGSRFERFYKFMAQTNVLPINKSVSLEEKADAPKITWWKRSLLILGFMKNHDEPQINGTALLFAILFALAMIYIFFGGAVNTLFMLDDKQADMMMQKTAARRMEDKFNKEQEKRAQILQLLKEKGLIQDVPENLKVFESNTADSDSKKEK